jgi:hypothetical protein
MKKSKKLTQSQRCNYYGLYFDFGFNKKMRFEEFLKPKNLIGIVLVHNANLIVRSFSRLSASTETATASIAELNKSVKKLEY